MIPTEMAVVACAICASLGACVGLLIGFWQGWKGIKDVDAVHMQHAAERAKAKIRMDRAFVEIEAAVKKYREAS